jgi:hypothetical protein
MKMPIIDEKGEFTLQPGTLLPKEDDNPAFRARIALALPLNSWLYAPANGHTLDDFKRARATPENVIAFEKEAKLYLSAYGPAVSSRFISRGQTQIGFVVTKETLFG